MQGAGKRVQEKDDSRRRSSKWVGCSVSEFDDAAMMMTGGI